eukprot:TRINITY_DN1793_c0_g1_i1.p1 TRINITY_DN1793_c0_g1~~TRINITY_DN1793_c0_g1_i1.p1  ORF type:complete len:410 (-),score=44.11 TRINITY_DN1793_c0_g1_i1:73-1302(-)
MRVFFCLLFLIPIAGTYRLGVISEELDHPQGIDSGYVFWRFRFDFFRSVIFNKTKFDPTAQYVPETIIPVNLTSENLNSSLSDIIDGIFIPIWDQPLCAPYAENISYSVKYEGVDLLAFEDQIGYECVSEEFGIKFDTLIENGFTARTQNSPSLYEGMFGNVEYLSGGYGSTFTNGSIGNSTVILTYEDKPAGLLWESGEFLPSAGKILIFGDVNYFVFSESPQVIAGNFMAWMLGYKYPAILNVSCETQSPCKITFDPPLTIPSITIFPGDTVVMTQNSYITVQDSGCVNIKENTTLLLRQEDPLPLGTLTLFQSSCFSGNFSSFEAAEECTIVTPTSSGSSNTLSVLIERDTQSEGCEEETSDDSTVEIILAILIPVLVCCCFAMILILLAVIVVVKIARSTQVSSF